MRLQKILNILGQFPKKSQKAVVSVVDFDKHTPSENYVKIVETMIALSKSQQQRELLGVYLDMAPTDEEILEAFNSKDESSFTPLYFTDEQVAFISESVYRNRDGEFRLIPKTADCSVESMPIDGLKADDDIISARLKFARVMPNGTSEEFDGLKELRKQPYDGPYDGVYAKLVPNLRRLKVISSFADGDPHGFFVRDGRMYRNVCSRMGAVMKDCVNERSFRRAMFLMFLVSGGRRSDWEALYNLVHFMVRVPNASTGYILYLNDFDAGGNGKSKFVGVLRRMFGDSFTSFSTQQLRFTMSLMGKRLVSISEYEDSDTAKQLQSMMKSMTGRDTFQYEGKGMDPVVADSYQNFVISSNRYIYFEDGGIKRRIQNFQCSNLLHVMTQKFTKSQEFLDSLFGNIFNGESVQVMNEMSSSLLDRMYSDSRQYSIPIREQPVILGSLRNPVLRALFSNGLRIESFCAATESGSRIDLARLEPDAKPEQFNYASSTMQQWFPDLELEPSRDNLSLSCPFGYPAMSERLEKGLSELDRKSSALRSRSVSTIEKCSFMGLDTGDLFEEFLGEAVRKFNIPVRTDDGTIQIGG